MYVRTFKAFYNTFSAKALRHDSSIKVRWEIAKKLKFYDQCWYGHVFTSNKKEFRIRIHSF